MSGICGIFQYDKQSSYLNRLDRMMKALEAHGPDGSGHWSDETTAFGHQMMCVTPESLNEQQPFSDGERRCTITMDGRIDNREELLGMLSLPLSSSLPDSQLVLLAYKKWGSACANHLAGEFALAIWDGREQCLHCVTDPMGIRPLFYTETPGEHFAFASEVVALLNLGDTPARLNQRRLAMLGVSAYTTYLEPDQTCFENIRRVPPASVLTISRAGTTVVEYWKPDYRQTLNIRSDAECREAFLDVFSKAVDARLRSAYPVASLLSGGLDSSGIVSIASERMARKNKELVTLSGVTMPAARSEITDEREFINLFRDRPNLKMRYVSAPGRGPFDSPEQLVESASLCSYSFQHFLYSAYSRVASRDNVRVILDGHGGEYSATCDPVGFGAELFLAGRWKTLAKIISVSTHGRSSSAAAFKRLVLRPVLPYSLLKRFNRNYKYNHLVEYPLQADFVRGVLGPEIEGIKDELFRNLAEFPDHRRNLVRNIKLEQSDISQRAHAGYAGYHKAALSYPYLDKRVIEFCLAVDGSYKYRDGTSRLLFRTGMQGLLPEKILNRNSKGLFSPDYHLRYQRQLPLAKSYLRSFSDSGKLDGIVDFSRVTPALDQTPAYNADVPIWFDYAPQFLVPNTVYLCYFLARFNSLLL